MKLVIMTIGLLMAGSLAAQDSWKIVLNKKLLLTAHEANETANVRLVKSSDWKKNCYLEVTYLEKQASNWHHSLRFADELGNELLVRDSVTAVKLSVRSLRKLFAGKKQLKIYMVISPPDPMMAVPTRMIHLGTLKLP